jgi:hypothetical protein
MRSHGVIPDTQVKPGVPIDHLGWAGRYFGEKRPDVIVHLGDFYDMPSLSSYDLADNPGEYHQRRYQDDLDAGDESVRLFESGLPRGYRPRKVYLVGNHEERYIRLIRAEPKLQGHLRPPWQYAKDRGWEVKPFLSPVTIDGVTYAHYFCRGPHGTVTNSKNGAPSARAQVIREMRSCIAGHKQGLDQHIQPTAQGMYRGIIAGSFYQHEEGYLTPQGTNYWRGILILHEVHNGNFNLMEVSLDYLRRRYGRKKAA